MKLSYLNSLRNQMNQTLLNFHPLQPFAEINKFSPNHCRHHTPYWQKLVDNFANLLKKIYISLGHSEIWMSSIQTPWCRLFLFNTLEMVLHFYWSPAVFNWIDCTWLGRTHTWLYKTLQLTVHIEKMWLMSLKELHRELRESIVARHWSGQSYEKNFCCT